MFYLLTRNNYFTNKRDIILLGIFSDHINLAKEDPNTGYRSISLSYHHLFNILYHYNYYGVSYEYKQGNN